MTQYIQYDDEGNITATILSNGLAPAHPRQLALETPVSTAGKRVDMATGRLVDAPCEETPAAEPSPPPEA